MGRENHENSLQRNTCTYDNDGNMQSLETGPITLSTYSWDFENRLTSADRGAATTNTYDPDGRLVQRDDSIAGITRFVWDEENVLRTETSTGDLVHLYTLEPLQYGNLISQRSQSASQFFDYDAQGSTSHLTDAAAATTNTFTYKAFGEQVASSGSNPPIYRWLGRIGYNANSGAGYILATLNVRARWYNPFFGRWISKDPLGVDAGINLFLYTSNRPTLYVDPSGQGIIVPAILVGGILGAIICACKRRGAWNDFGGQPLSDSQASCVAAAATIIEKAGFPGVAKCANTMTSVGASTPGNSPYTWCALCGTFVFIPPADLQCGNCKDMIKLIATLFHECIHVAECKPTEKTAYCYEWKFLHEKLARVLCGTIPCANRDECIQLIHKIRDEAAEHCNENGGSYPESGPWPVK